MKTAFFWDKESSESVKLPVIFSDCVRLQPGDTFELRRSFITSANSKYYKQESTINTKVTRVNFTLYLDRPDTPVQNVWLVCMT
jgi:hypothetical protein